MTTIDKLTQDHGDLLHAIEELRAFQVTAASMGCGLESIDGHSNSFKLALEEEKAEKKQGVFKRLINFFRSLWERVKKWAKDRMERNRAAGAEKLKEQMDKNRAAAKAHPKAAQNLEEEFKKQLSALYDDALKQLSSSEFLKKELATLSGEYGGVCALSASTQDARDLLQAVGRIKSNLDMCFQVHHSAVDSAKQGRGQAVQQTERLNELLGKCATDGRFVATTAATISQFEPKNVYDLIACIKDDKAIQTYLAAADTEDFNKRLEDIEADLGPLLKLFEDIANADPDSLGGTAREIYELEPSVLMAIVQAPAHFMAVIGRLDTATSQITPNTLIDLKTIARKAVNSASGGKGTDQVVKHAVDMVVNHLQTKL